jgi:hypothetical protein
MTEFIYKNVPKDALIWLYREIKELRLSIKKQELISKYNSYVVYDYEPFCSDDYKIHITISGNESSILYLQYKIEERGRALLHLGKCVSATCDKSLIHELEQIPGRR